MFGGQLPKWLLDPKKEPEPTKVEEKKPDGGETVIPEIAKISATMGILPPHRFYVFFIEQEGATAHFSMGGQAVQFAARGIMTPFGKHPSARSSALCRGAWGVTAQSVKVGTIIKAFAGFAPGDLRYGHKYMIVDSCAETVELSHPDEPRLSVSGKMRPAEEHELVQSGISIIKSRNHCLEIQETKE
jgi:hypothetical protein